MSDEAARVHREVTDRLSQRAWLADPDLEAVRDVGPVDEPAADGAMATEGRAPWLPDRVHPEDRETIGAWIDGIRADVAAGSVADRYQQTFRVVDGEGEHRRLSSVAIPLRDGESVTAFAGFTTDVTEQVAQERELLTRVDRLDDFASMVSHDLRNPLAAAQGHLDLYREHRDPDHLESVAAALDRIGGIADEILSLARHGVEEGDRAPISIASVARATWGEIDTREATLEVADDVTVEAADAQLRQLLVNLFRNAVGHGGDEVTVRVGPLVDGFYVEDTGSGIPESERERVFEQGYTTGYAGSGVGLTVVSRVAEAHGWTVELAETEAGGARFEFRTAPAGPGEAT